MSDDPFPEWSEPATKGDVVSALVATRSCIIDIYTSLLALNVGNKEKLAEYLKKLDTHDEELRRMIYEVAGGKVPE